MRAFVICWVLFGLSDAFAQSDQARGRIFRVETFQGDGVKLFASFLDASGEPLVLGDHVLSLRVSGRKENQDGKKWEEFEDESPTLTESSTVETLGSSGIPLDIVLVAGAHEDSTREQALNDALRESATLLLKKIPKTARINLIWLTDEARVFVKSKDLGARVIDFWQPSKRRFCQVADEKYYSNRVDSGAEAIHPCGLIAEGSLIGAAIKNSADTFIEGSYPRLFSLPKDYCKKPEVEHPLDQKLAGDAISQEVYNEQMSTGALDVALQYIASYARPGSMRVVLYLGDGKDGYLKADADCRVGLRQKCQDTFRSSPRGYRASKERKEKVSACVAQGVKNHVVEMQRIFVEKAQKLLPAFRSLNTRLDVVLLPTSERYEEERVRLLSLQTGGSFRIADDAQDLVVKSEAMAKEITETIVVSFVPESARTLPEGSTREISVEITVPGADENELDIQSQWARYEAPTLDHSFTGKLSSMKSWLDGKIGKTASRWVIVFLALLLAFIGFKILKKLFQKIMGLFKKAGGGA